MTGFASVNLLGNRVTTREVVLIEEQVLGSTAASVTFSSIPGTYDELAIEVVTRSDRAGSTQDSLQIRVGNGSVDTGTNYHYAAVEDGQTTNTGTGATSAYACRFGLPGASSTASVFGAIRIEIPQYANTSFHKQIRARGGFIDTTNIHAGYSLARWGSTSAIDTITLFPLNGPNFVANSVFRLYGIGTT